MPQHIWSAVSDPATYADAKPVGTGPFMLDQFSPQGYTLKQNPLYWKKSKVHVPEIDFPAYNTNANLVPPISSGQIDFAGNYVANIKSNFLAKSPENHTWLSSQPYFSANNVVSMYLNTTKAPLNDPAVRQAISYGINRQQLNVQGETGLRAAGQFDQRAAAAQPPVVPGPVAGQQPPGHRRRGQGHLDPQGGRLHQVGRQVGQEREDDQVRDPGPGPVQRLLHRRPDHLAPAERARLRHLRGRHRQPDRVGGQRRERHVRRHPALEQPGPEPVLHLRRLDGQLAGRADRQASRG